MEGRVFALTSADAEKGNETIQSILSLYGIDEHALFDTGSTHSFIGPHVLCHVPISSTTFSYYLLVSMPRNEILVCSDMLLDCEIKVHDMNLLGDLVVLDIQDFDLILSMDWLFRHFTTMDCQSKIIYFELPQQPVIVYRGVKPMSTTLMISIMKTKRLIDVAMRRT